MMLVRAAAVVAAAMVVLDVCLTAVAARQQPTGAYISANGLRLQRGDQGPDMDGGGLGGGRDRHANTRVDAVLTVRGPNVCRSQARSFCCPGWVQRGVTGLCIVPVCSHNR
jgi:hypothetical protein